MKIKYTHSSGIYIIVETTDSGDIPNIDSKQYDGKGWYCRSV